MSTWMRFRRHVPNLLTMIRVLITLVIIALFHLGVYENVWGRLLVADLFILAAMTDYYDGRLAKRWDCKSPLGAFLDPLADKLLSWAGLAILWGQLPVAAPLLLFLFATILAYDLSTSTARVLKALGFRVKLVTSQTARERTCILLGTLVAFLASEVARAVWPDPVVEWFMIAILAIAFVVVFVWTLKSGYEYLEPYLNRTVARG